MEPESNYVRMNLRSCSHALHLSGGFDKKRERDVIWGDAKSQHLGVEVVSFARLWACGEGADEEVEDEKVRTLNLGEDSVRVFRGFEGEREETAGDEDVGDEMGSYEEAMDDLEVGEGRAGLE